MASEFTRIRGLGRLRPAERQLCEAAAAGEIAFIGRGKHRRSPPRTARGAIRPALIRFLALGGGAGLTVHARGVRAVGAWIAGDVDLSGGNVRVPLELEACRVTGKIILTGARLASLRLSRSRVGGVEAADLRVSGEVNLASASFDHRVNFDRARIGSDFDLSGAAIAGLGLASATVGGRLVLRNIRVPRGTKAAISLDGVRAGELLQDETSTKFFADAETPPGPAPRNGLKLLLVAALLLLLAGQVLWSRTGRQPMDTKPTPPSVAEPKPPVVQPASPPVVEPKPPVVEPTPPPVVEPKPPLVEPTPPRIVEPKPPAMEQTPPPVIEPKPPVVEPAPPPVIQPELPVLQPTPPPVVAPKPPMGEPSLPPVVEPKPPVVAPPPPPVVRPKPPITGAKPAITKPKRRPVTTPRPAPKSEYMRACASAHSDREDRA